MSFFEFSASKTRYHNHGRMHVEGGVLPEAITAYRTYGEPKNPCVVYPTCYGARLDCEVLIPWIHQSINSLRFIAQESFIGADKVFSTILLHFSS